jgi:hypothetical protein
MRYLVKIGDTKGLAMHIPDETGRPLCAAKIKLADWRVEHRPEGSGTVCWHCRRTYAKLHPSKPRDDGQTGEGGGTFLAR